MAICLDQGQGEVADVVHIDLNDDDEEDRMRTQHHQVIWII